jgi:multidrug resistance efflux pump
MNSFWEVRCVNSFSFKAANVLVLMMLFVVCIACSACGRKDQSQNIIIVSAPVAGEIRRVMVREGMQVVADQTIAEIAVYATAQSTPLAQVEDRQARAARSIQAANAEIEAARAEVVRHEVEVQRLTVLVASGQASQGDLDGERALYDQAQQRFQKARNAAQEAQAGLIAARQPDFASATPFATPLAETVMVRAGNSGIVTAIAARVGERVTAGQPLATLRSH